MRFLLIIGLVESFLLSIVPGLGGTLDKAPVSVQPSATPPWEITVEGPGWLAGVTGTIGSHGVTTHVNISVVDILKKTNAIASLGAEVRRGNPFSRLGYPKVGAPIQSAKAQSRIWLRMTRFGDPLFETLTHWTLRPASMLETHQNGQTLCLGLRSIHHASSYAPLVRFSHRVSPLVCCF